VRRVIVVSSRVLEALFSLLYAPVMSSFDVGVILAPTVVMIRSRDSYAFCPEREATIIARGLSWKTVVATVHSMAFFNIPGRLKTYSGVQMMTPAAPSISVRNSRTFVGRCSASVLSGLKYGRSERLS
jgi:hypothetical protein